MINADLAVARAQPIGKTGQAVVALAGSFLIALCAQAFIPLPFTPVPVSGSTFAVALLAAWLGPRLGVAAVALYLLEGAVGLPFFAQGHGGAVWLASPTGGYLLAFLPAAWVIGTLTRKSWARTAPGAVAAILAGSAVVFAGGLLGLSRFLPADQLLSAGLLPFLPGDLAKSCAVAALLPLARRLPVAE